MPIIKKTGKLNVAEKTFIRQNYLKQTDEWIAEQLNRSVKLISLYRDEIEIELRVAEKVTAISSDLRYVLENKPYWKDLKKQFNTEELAMFVYHWTEMIAQFNEDVTHSEEMQILDLIKSELLIARNLAEKAQSAIEIERIEKNLDFEFSKKEHEQDKQWIEQLRNDILSWKMAQRANTDEYIKLDKQKQALFKDLKSTRDQRKRTADDSKSQFKDLLASLEEEKNRRRAAQEMAIRKKALEQETERLSAYHTYVNGEIDQPILTPETVKDDING